METGLRRCRAPSFWSSESPRPPPPARPPPQPRPEHQLARRGLRAAAPHPACHVNCRFMPALLGPPGSLLGAGWRGERHLPPASSADPAGTDLPTAPRPRRGPGPARSRRSLSDWGSSWGRGRPDGGAGRKPENAGSRSAPSGSGLVDHRAAVAPGVSCLAGAPSPEAASLQF